MTRNPFELDIEESLGGNDTLADRAERRKAIASSVRTSNRERGGRGRKTGRTMPFATKVNPQLKKKIDADSKTTGISIAEMTELAFAAYFKLKEGKNA